MGLINMIKNIFNRETKSEKIKVETFPVNYTLWVGEPMDGYRSYTKTIDVPKSLVDKASYRRTRDAVYNYIQQHDKRDVALYDLYNNDYIKTLFMMNRDLNKVCPLSDKHEEMIDNIKSK